MLNKSRRNEGDMKKEDEAFTSVIYLYMCQNQKSCSFSALSCPSLALKGLSSESCVYLLKYFT